MISDTPMVELTIDGQPLRVPAGTSIWEGARTAGIEIPPLCHDPGLEPVGSVACAWSTSVNGCWQPVAFGNVRRE
ncbi:MAG: hypothetical protein CM1200mP2_32130 [Planctomycetaceae bacterium]|nr:MAG: hypothetical protein CM1200mP2_32130 [Planctomycetaceae bacterium]